MEFAESHRNNSRIAGILLMGSLEKSDKSYGVAVSLCGVFGVLGLHHFYLRNFLHGLVDLSMFLIGVYLLFVQESLWGLLVLLVDTFHTIVVFYLLITEQARDGDGRLVKLTYQDER